MVASIGSLLFGYNTSIISGALLFLSHDFQLTVFQEELVVSTVLIGAVIGALVGGFIADRIGRKKTLFVTILLFFIGSLILTDANGIESLLIGRLISGMAIGITSMAVPLYIAEISPARNRGSMVCLAQLMITIGILLAYFVQFLFAEESEWRQMFGFGLVPLAIQFFGLFFILESPSYLMNKGKIEEAQKVCSKLGISMEKSSVIRLKSSWKMLLSPKTRRPLCIGIGISVFQQITGINTVIYYGPKIFQLAEGRSAQSAIFATLLVGIVNAVMTVISLWLVDRLGRRFLLILGLVGMATALGVLGASMIIRGTDGIGALALGSIMIYVAFFAMSLGPVAWLINSEIYPVEVRGIAMSVASIANWVCNYLVSISFLTLLVTFGSAATFLFYMAICIWALWFVIKNIPETKGKTLEQIQQFWQKE